jgi:hypothetical protein
LTSLVVSTSALKSNAAGDATYTSLENQLASLGTQRDALAGHLAGALNAATFGGQALDEQQAKSLIDQGQSLLDSMSTLAGN